MRSGVTAAAWAEQQVASVRDDPAGRITLMDRCYYGPFGQAPRHLPFRRAALSFMRWQLQRGVLQPPFSDRPGSPWWRAVNERILRDGCEAVGLSGELPGPASSRTVDYWMSFADYPIARAWYRSRPAVFRRFPAGQRGQVRVACLGDDGRLTRRDRVHGAHVIAPESLSQNPGGVVGCANWSRRR